LTFPAGTLHCYRFLSFVMPPFRRGHIHGYTFRHDSLVVMRHILLHAWEQTGCAVAACTYDGQKRETRPRVDERGVGKVHPKRHLVVILLVPGTLVSSALLQADHEPTRSTTSARLDAWLIHARTRHRRHDGGLQVYNIGTAEFSWLTKPPCALTLVCSVLIEPRPYSNYDILLLYC
jgi:hypothetical protein